MKNNKLPKEKRRFAQGTREAKNSNQVPANIGRALLRTWLLVIKVMNLTALRRIFLERQEIDKALARALD